MDLACLALQGALWDLGVLGVPAGLPSLADPPLPWHQEGREAPRWERRRCLGLGERGGHTPCDIDPASHSVLVRESCAPVAGWLPAAAAPWPPRRPRPPPACGGSAVTRPGPANPPHFWAQWRRRPGALRGLGPPSGSPDGCARPPCPGGFFLSQRSCSPNRRSGWRSPPWAGPRTALQGSSEVLSGADLTVQGA